MNGVYKLLHLVTFLCFVSLASSISSETVMSRIPVKQIFVLHPSDAGPAINADEFAQYSSLAAYAAKFSAEL